MLPTAQARHAAQHVTPKISEPCSTASCRIPHRTGEEGGGAHQHRRPAQVYGQPLRTRPDEQAHPRVHRAEERPAARARWRCPVRPGRAAGPRPPLRRRPPTRSGPVGLRHGAARVPPQPPRHRRSAAPDAGRGRGDRCGSAHSRQRRSWQLRQPEHHRHRHRGQTHRRHHRPVGAVAVDGGDGDARAEPDQIRRVPPGSPGGLGPSCKIPGHVENQNHQVPVWASKRSNTNRPATWACRFILV